MIIDQIRHAASYFGISRNIASALGFIRDTALNGLSTGKHVIAGDTVYALVSEYQTKPAGQGQWEAHRRYVDIQCIVSGEEQMGYAAIAGLKELRPYEPEKDCLLLEGQGEFLIARPGMFVLFMPQDAHMPGLAVKEPGFIKKVVVKVLV